MTKLNIGLIGYGNVGQGLVKFIHKWRAQIKQRSGVDLNVVGVCDRSIHKKETALFSTAVQTTDAQQILNHPDIDVVVELIGGLTKARQLVIQALKNGKHVVTANKELIANDGPELFRLARENGVNIFFESSVMAGVPVIKTITEGVAGNQYNELYGIINGTCNFVLSEMTDKNLTFAEALAEAQKKGYAESDPTLDINGMDAAHKLGILVMVALGKHIPVKNIHTEGITHISFEDIENAKKLDLSIKLLAIAKRTKDGIEARVHPTLIANNHPLASINGIFNAIFMDTTPLGDILLSGEGAGQFAAASGVVSDLINLASRKGCASNQLLANFFTEEKKLNVKKIDQARTKFYIRITATDKPGVLSKITGIFGKHGISINSVQQRAHNTAAAVPVIILTEYAQEGHVRNALKDIHKLPVIKAKPVAIRMENLPLR